jgi:hypothetical protein
MTLLYNRSTSALDTEVETKRGVAILYGKAGDVAEKNLATKLAKDVNVVTGVKEPDDYRVVQDQIAGAIRKEDQMLWTIAVVLLILGLVPKLRDNM